MINAAEVLAVPPRIPSIYLEGRLVSLQASTAAELKLQDAQVVQAAVRLIGGETSLLLKGKMIEAPNIPSAQVGQSIWLRVQERADGQWGLLPLAPGQAPGLAALANPLVSRIANLLYRPSGMTDLSQVLQGRQMAPLLENLARPDLQAQWQGLQLSLAALTPQALRTALMGALGSEVWLARGRNSPGNDPKQFLRGLLDALQNEDRVSGDERNDTQQVQRAIDQLEANQVQAVQAQAQREVMFSMTLPFVDGNPVELTFRRPPRGEGEPPAITVNVHSKSETLGPVWLQTKLSGTEKVELTMWAEMADVAQQARARQSELAQELSAAGLNLQAFKVVHGARPEQAADWTPSGRGLVVDISA
jgi:hypothetical protein